MSNCMLPPFSSSQLNQDQPQVMLTLFSDQMKSLIEDTKNEDDEDMDMSNVNDEEIAHFEN